MNDNWDKYLDPPDEPEAEFCEECGEEMEFEGYDSYPTNKKINPLFVCLNPFCPNKYGGIPKEMAEKLVEVLAENHMLKSRNNYLELAMERKWNATKK